MKWIVRALLPVLLLLIMLQAAFALSPIGESGTLRDYGFTLVSAETKAGVYGLQQGTSLTLHFTFTNGSDSALVGIPLDTRARQGG